MAFLKIKEFTFVNNCFQKGRNAEIGLFGQALNKIGCTLLVTIQAADITKVCKSTDEALWLTPQMGVREAELWAGKKNVHELHE